MSPRALELRSDGAGARVGDGLTLLTPVFALGLALLIYRERLSAPGLAGVAATAAGVMWVSWPRLAAR